MNSRTGEEEGEHTESGKSRERDEERGVQSVQRESSPEEREKKRKNQKEEKNWSLQLDVTL